jgi:hypothetical protein
MVNLVVSNSSKESTAIIFKDQAVPEPPTRYSVTSRNNWIVSHADVRNLHHALIATDFLEEAEEYGGVVPYLKSQVTQSVHNSD